MLRPLPIAGIFLFLWLWPTTDAHAHLVIQDSALFSGIVNPLIHIPSLLLALAYGCWTGQNLKRHRLSPVHALWIVGPVLLGSCIGLPGLPDSLTSNTVMFLAFLSSVLTAMEVGCPLILWGGLGILTGEFLGAYNVQDVRLPFLKQFFFISGSTLTLGALVFFPALLITQIQNHIFRIGIRIAGSWMAAISAMMLTYGLRAK